MRFGKGRHAARLNYGDCMSYAYAAVTGRMLVYTVVTDLAKLYRLDVD